MLYLHGSPIRKISGPVSMTYLKGLEGLPLVLLFGDYHFSLENMCENCDPSDGCYVIYENPFLEKLDAIGERFAVDFFTETYRGQQSSPTGGVLFGELIRVALDCHDVPMRSRAEYEFRCPTRNIRWHYSDARLFDSRPEGNLFQRQWKNANMPYLTQEEPALLISPEMKSLSDTVLEFVQFALENKLSYRDIMHDIADIIIDNVTSMPGSLIAKQQSDIDLKGLWKMPTLIETIDRDLKSIDPDFFKFFTDFVSPTQPVTINKVVFMSAARKRLPYMKPYTIATNLNFCTHLLIHIEAPLLDSYHVSRMFKRSLNSKLIVSYLGNAHSINIAEFLQYELGYDLAYTTHVGPNRCLEFKEDIDIESDLRPFRPIPDPDIESKEEADPYFLQLRQERLARIVEYPETVRRRIQIIDPQIRRIFRLIPPLAIIDSSYSTTMLEWWITKMKLDEEDRVLDYLRNLLQKVFSWTHGVYNKSFLSTIEMTCVALSVAKVARRVEPFPNTDAELLAFLIDQVDAISSSSAESAEDDESADVDIFSL